MMKLIVHADDFGITKSVTNDILECLAGPLNSTSVIANGRSFDYAMSKFKKFNNKRLTVHINFLEGEPVVDPKYIPMHLTLSETLIPDSLSFF